MAKLVPIKFSQVELEIKVMRYIISQVIVIGVMGGLNIRAVSNREGRLSTEST